MSPVVPTGWAQTDRALTRTVRRADFVDALAFITEVGRLAEAVNHHPDIDIRHRNVHLSLSTHDAGNQVTERDFALALKINDVNEDAVRILRDDLRRRFLI